MASEPYRPTVDHLGFALETESDQQMYEKSQAQYLRILAKRSQRWKPFISLNQYKYNSGKLRRFVRKGIPNEHRPMFWMKVSGAESLMNKSPALYKALQSQIPPEEVIQAIDMDLPRTFPENIHFKDSGPDSLRPGLRRVLSAFALKNPAVGYCQGLNYVAAVMLIVLRDEQKTFWLLHTVATVLLPDYYVGEPVAMLGLQTDLNVLSALAKDKAPAVSTMMGLHKADWSFVCTKWFVCLYIDILPIETVLRIWDAFFYEGRKVLFRVALTLIKKGEVTLLTCTAIHHIMKAFQAVSKDTYTWYSHIFMNMIYEESGVLTSQYLSELTKESRAKALRDSQPSPK